MAYIDEIKMKRVDLRYIQADETVYKRITGYPEYRQEDIDRAKIMATNSAFEQLHKEIYNKSLPEKFSCDFELKQAEPEIEMMLRITANIVIYTKEIISESVRAK